jgi:WG containing repeat
MPEGDEPAQRRRRPRGPAWATVPTMQWDRVVPQQRDDTDDEWDELDAPPQIPGRHGRPDPLDDQAPAPVSPPVQRGRRSPAPPGRGVARPGGPARMPVGDDGPASGQASVPAPRTRRQPPPRPADEPIRPLPSRAPRPGMPGTGPWSRDDLPTALTAPTPPGGMPALSPLAEIPLPEEAGTAPWFAAHGPDEPTSPAPVSAAPASGLPAAESDTPDPEQILAGWEWVFDPETLREVNEDEEGLLEIREMLTGKMSMFPDNASRARLLSLRAIVSRILGDLTKALADGKLALAHAEATGELRRIAIAQARLAHVHQWRGEFEEADRLFALANSTELPDRLRASMHQHAGRCAYDQNRFMEACNHFERALELRKEEDPELIAQTELALDAVFRRVAEHGWGPYPRGREEILQIRKPPTPALDESTGLWGFIDAEGETCVPADYADVQPFRDGVAWVLRPDQQSWELIDEGGQTLIPGHSGYIGVSSFSDGLAWVSRDGTGRWIGIDKSNNVTISTGFEDVRPFRRGMAAVQRHGRWGAVDGVGRVVVQFGYDAFATAMSDGRYIDGFSDEGLAVVELSGRKGVVDRTGRVLVEPRYPALVIHPVAFLITDGAHRWGALDRRGRLLIKPSHPSRMGVSDEIDRLLSDARPIL